MSRPRVTHFGTSAQGQEDDIAVPALDPHSWVVRQSLVFVTGRGLYGNHLFSVYPLRPLSLASENRPESPSDRRYTENSSFPYTPNVVALTPAALLPLITFPDLPPKEPV